MSEERLKALEEHVTNVRIENARLSGSIDHLSTAVGELTGVVQEFRDTLNKGKGAVWLFGAVSVAIGGLVSWATTHLFR